MSAVPVLLPGVGRMVAFTSARRGRLVLLPFAFVILVVLLAVLGPVLIRIAPESGDIANRLLPPFGHGEDGVSHLLGTDQYGRDVFSRLVYGGRISLSVGIIGVGLATIAGTAVGLAAGLRGGVTDALLMRGVDVTLSIPPILIAILIAAVTKPSVVTVLIAIGLTLWPAYARLVRAEVLVIRESDYVAYALVAGCSKWTVARRHILINILPSVIVLATVHLGVAIVLEASLSFIGLGLPVSTSSWGIMVSDGRNYLDYWWLAVAPGLAIFLTVLSFNVIGDWARVRFDPRLAEVS